MFAIENIGKYEIKAVLGKGGMGVVYHGYDPTVERDVAIKTIHPHLIDDKDGEEFLARFTHEAKAAARCTHPNIVTILEFGRDGDMPFIVMEFVDGVPLNEYLEKKKVRYRQVLKILLQLLKALHFAHKQGIVHRDIKPANILISKDGYIKLADFGIARLPTSELTQVGYAVGTPRYISPEQARGEQADQRSDLFAVGVIFLEMLSEMAADPAILTTSIKKVEGIPPTVNIDFSKGYPNQLLNVLSKSIQTDPAARFQNAQEFGKSVQDALKKRTVPTPPPTVAPAGSTIVFSTDEMTTLKQELVSRVGSAADQIIQSGLQSGKDKLTIIEKISEQIPSAQDRQSFLSVFSTNAKLPDTQLDVNAATVVFSEATPPPTYIDAATLDKLHKSYAVYMGPIAEVMVKKLLHKYTSPSQLIEALAEKIPDDTERREFLRDW